MVWQAAGEIVKVWVAPQLTDTLPQGEIAPPPEGEIVPPLPAEAVIVNVLRLNDAEIVWVAVTFVNVKLEIAPCDTPSTRTLAIVWHASGEIVTAWFAPTWTDTLP